MDVTPATPAKRSRAKTSGPATEKVAKSPAPAKKPRASTRKARVETPIATTEPVVTVAPSPQELQGMIATAAYYLAAERNFSPGRELDDWLEAERRIRATLFG
jgi:hypothetical protein